MAKGIYKRGKIWWIRYAGLDGKMIFVSMKKIILLILCFTVMHGCYYHPGMSEAKRRFFEVGQDDYDNYPKVPRLGLTVEMRDNKLIVSDVVKYMPAYQAKMKAGDIVVSLDGLAITSPPEFRMVLNNKKSNNEVSLMLIRNGKTLDITVTPALQKVRPTSMMLDKLVLDGKHVHAAIIVSEVTNSHWTFYADHSSDERYLAWIDRKRKSLQAGEESELLKSYNGVKNFSIVDSSQLKRILDELQSSQIEFTSDKARSKIEEMAGATHIIDITYERYSVGRIIGPWCGMETNVRLIDTGSGKILATDTRGGAVDPYSLD